MVFLVFSPKIDEDLMAKLLNTQKSRELLDANIFFHSVVCVSKKNGGAPRNPQQKCFIFGKASDLIF